MNFQSMYKCETCSEIVKQVYGAKVNNRFIYQCIKCTFKKK